VDERVELVHRHSREGAANRKAFALVTRRRGGEPADGPEVGAGIQKRQAGQDEHIVDGDGGHLRPS
jgi:hypothetical protein